MFYDLINIDPYMSENYVLAICRCYDVLLVPKDAFFAVCDVDENRAKEKQDNEWHPMCGGFDTWCQSYAVNHARGWGVGEFDEAKPIIGIYYLEI